MFEVIDYVNVEETTSLYLWLVVFLIKAAKPGKELDDKKVTNTVKSVFSEAFLTGKARKSSRYISKVQMIARCYTTYLLECKKPIVGIAPIMRAINALANDEEVSGLHTQFAMLCLKAKCF